MGKGVNLIRNLPRVLFGDPGVVKIGFLAKFHAGLTYFYNCSMIFLKIVIFEKIFVLTSVKIAFLFWDDLEAEIGISIQT